MSVIIRLQNLPWAANAADIRQYFQGLSIPEGGVHIVGGEKGDAFISFSTDEDARQAMLSDGGCIKDVQIRLLLSSRNEMQKVIETARQQTMQLTQVYMQQMQQPQIPIVGSLPPLTAKVLPQPQQPVRPERMINMLHRNTSIMDGAGMLLVPLDKQHLQQQQQQQQQQHPHLSPKLLENKDRDDKGHKRERTRSKSRDRRSKSSRSGGGGSRRDRSRSRDRRRRDRSRGRDRSRDRYRSGGGRNSSSHGSGGSKSHRSRSPGGRVMAEGGGKAGMQGDLQQQTSVRSWNCQFDNGAQQHAADGQHQMTNSGPGGVGNMQQFGQFRTPPQPPIIASMPPNQFNQQQQPPNPHDWTMGGGGDQQPYEPDNDFRSNVYGAGSDDDDEDDRQAEYDNGFHRRYNNDNAGGPPPGMRRGPPGQDYNQQQHGYGGGGGPNNRGPRFHQKQPGGPQNRGGHRQFDDFRSGGGGPRFNNSHQQQQQQPPRYGRGGISDGGGGGRPSRFSSVHDGGRPSRFNPAAPQHRNDGGGDEADFSADDSGNKRLPQQQQPAAPRFNDRYRYDVRNAAAPQQAAVTARADGLCVEVNNMSNHFSYGDVRKLFDGIHIDGSAIKIQKHRQGVAFVRFDSNHNKNLALRVNGNMYKGNHIVVKHLDDEAYERDNTDDRPYPSTVVAATPTIVDHVDLVDDDDEDDDGGQKSTAPAQKKADDGNAAAGGEKNAATSAAAAAANDAPVKTEADGGEERSKTQQQPQQQQQQPDPPTKYLQLKQLPITVTEEEVLNEIDGGGEVRRVTFYPDGEFMGAALEFNNVDAAEAALKRFDCVLLGSTPVPVLRCTYKEYVQIKRKSGGGGRRFSGDGGGGRHHHHHHQSHQSNVTPSSGPQQQPPVHPVPPVVRSNCVYVYGLPTTVTNTDIMQFFGETSVLPDKIHIMLSKFGRPTGESYCEFGTAQQAQTAMSKDQCYMGPNLVYVEPISRSIMIQAITKPMQQINHPPDMSWGPGGGPRQQHGGGGGPRQQHHHGVRGPAQQQQQQPSYGGGGHNGPYARPQYMNNGGARGGGGGGYTPRMRGPGPGPNTGPDGFGQPGCVVALDNVPYRADVQEIVDFFDGFELNSQNVIRRFNDFGKPTGEARVNLRNPQEAGRAVRTLQNKPIFNRPVRLTLL